LGRPPACGGGPVNLRYMVAEALGTLRACSDDSGILRCIVVEALRTPPACGGGFEILQCMVSEAWRRSAPGGASSSSEAGEHVPPRTLGVSDRPIVLRTM